MAALIEINPHLDRPALAARFQALGRLQVIDFLTPRCAEALRTLMAAETPWSLAWQAGKSAPAALIGPGQLRGMSSGELEAIAGGAAADPEYGFAYFSYPLVTAYLERWSPGSPHERLLEELNGPDMLDFMRGVTGMSGIVKMDGQATLYGPGHFLRPHTDAESERGRLVAYVLGLTAGEWREEWGGCLNFLDDRLRTTQSFPPRFNSLSLFTVPQWHEVGKVAASAPAARYAITGWARDR
jgi:hypothetical protein